MAGAQGQRGTHDGAVGGAGGLGGDVVADVGVTPGSSVTIDVGGVGWQRRVWSTVDRHRGPRGRGLRAERVKGPPAVVAGVRPTS